MKWIIDFCDAKNIGIWKLFTKHRKGFSHCFAVQYIPAVKHWICMEFVTRGFKASILTDDEATNMIGFMVKHCKCIEYEPTDKPIYVPRWLYCVSFMKHLCNVRKFWVLTPYQLYCELKKRGGKSIFEDNKENSNGQPQSV